MTTSLRLRSALLLLVSLAAAACSSAPEPRWVEVRVSAADLENLQEACNRAVVLSDFQITHSDIAKGRVESRWREDLFTFRRPGVAGGFRQRAFVEIEPAPEGARTPDGRHARVVRVRVEQERNDEVASPSESAKAVWEPAPDDVAAAQRIAFTVQAQVGSDFRPSDDFYRRHGLEPATQEPKSP